MQETPTPNALAAALGLHPLIGAVLWARGCRDVAVAQAFLDPARYTPAPPAQMPGMSALVARLQRAIADGEHIRIWGDFDVDGQTATSVLLLGLRSLGARVDFTIPDRAVASHGLNADGLRRTAADGVRVLLTCDCGITDFALVELAASLGLDVLISDHHDPEYDADGRVTLPAAHAVVNPKLLPPDHPLGQLPGVGAAWKIIEALVGAERAAPLLDLVALGIVADVAVQRGDTRFLLQRGLENLRGTQRPGVRALLRVAGTEAHSLDADTIAFQIGPRLNAAGRMAHASLSVELLTTDDEARADALAAQIEQHNVERRALQKEIEAAAAERIEADPGLVGRAALVLHGRGWQASIIGIVASGLVERYGKPTVMIALQDDGVGRASARSVPGVDIHAAISCAHDLTLGGGGHPMAAGFGIREENIAAFVERLSEAVAAQKAAALGVEAPAQESYHVAWRDAALPLAEQLEQLAPFGAGNSRPLLVADGLRFVRSEPLGKDGRHRTLLLSDGGDALARATWWRSAHLPLPEPGAPLTLQFTLRRDVWRERVRAQIEVVAVQTTSSPGTKSTSDAARFRIVDLRGAPERETALDALRAELGAANVAVWRERAPEHEPRAVLALWDAPPGMEELRAALAAIQPTTVVLLNEPTSNADAAAFVQDQVRRMISTAAKRGDALDDEAVQLRMARRINQRPATIRAALAAWRGDPDALAQLDYLLNETCAWRRFMAEAPAAQVLAV
jgi:single-stranded-DNA-specific exonuclease